MRVTIRMKLSMSRQSTCRFDISDFILHRLDNPPHIKYWMHYERFKKVTGYEG